MFVTLSCFLGLGILFGLTPFAFPSLRVGLVIPTRKEGVIFHLAATLPLACFGALMGASCQILIALSNSRVLTVILAIGMGSIGAFKLVRPTGCHWRPRSGFAIVLSGLIAGVLNAVLIFPLMAYTFPALLDPPTAVRGALELAALGLGIGLPSRLLAEVIRGTTWPGEIARHPSFQRTLQRMSGGILVLAAAVYGVICLHPRPALQERIGVDLRWYTDESTAMQQARLRHLPVMIDFSAAWCFPCHALDELVFSAKDVVEEIEKRVIPLRLDLTEDNARTQAWAKRYGVDSLPAVVFVTPNGKILDSPRLNGVVPPEAFLAALRSL